jgi:hypothetical protein
LEIVLASTVRLIPGERAHRTDKGFDARGAVLVASGMLALVYTLVEAPDQGWSSFRWRSSASTGSARPT